ncbi:hypothetical protein CSOJ01_07830 [Colletotrichum sojae]|uniref:Uncharacterized protein n=1 Tax=Colletotrichum sojae TaxID=2175907 RepID=A0A8H6MTS2_9PEZI|nr:hypothetical protein CSOJ01_07830 [Colletotrichum sojae]
MVRLVLSRLAATPCDPDPMLGCRPFDPSTLRAWLSALAWSNSRSTFLEGGYDPWKTQNAPVLQASNRSAEMRSTSTQTLPTHTRGPGPSICLFAPWNDSHVRRTDLHSASGAAIRQALYTMPRGSARFPGPELERKKRVGHQLNELDAPAIAQLAQTGRPSSSLSWNAPEEDSISRLQ